MTNTPPFSFSRRVTLIASLFALAMLIAEVPASAQDDNKPVTTDSQPKKSDDQPKPSKEETAKKPDQGKTDKEPQAAGKKQSNKQPPSGKKTQSGGKDQPDKKDQADNKEVEPAIPAEGKNMDNSSKASSETKAKPKPTPPAPATEDPAIEKEWISKGVWLSPPTEGPAAIDFNLVGEYVGEVESDKGKGKPLSVQIRTLGSGEFEARAYKSGLPGQDGFTEDDMLVLIGRRSGENLVLSGGPWAMFVGPKQCKVISAEGQILGELPRANRASPTLGAKAPKGAMVLFDGTNTKAFASAEMTPHGLLRQGANIDFMLSDFDLHLEFRIPHMPQYTEQARGNSGLYLQSRYECQVLDSFGAPRVFNGLGALYRYRPADVNMAFPPLVWQTYDIHFTAARFAADGRKLRNAEVTSWVNGIKVQDKQSLPGPTGAGKDESPTLLPTLLQNHKDPVRYRNIWVIDRGLTGGIEFPQMADSK